MEAGGLIAEVGWTEYDFSFEGEESEMMTQLFGSFPSHGEQGHQELPWADQASNAYSGSIGSCLVVPPAYEGCYFSSSNEALVPSSCIAPDGLTSLQEPGAAEFLNMVGNHSLDFYGSSGPSCEDLDDSSVSMPDSVSATNKRKHLVEELGGQTRGRKCARKAETKRTKRGKQSGEDDASTVVASGSPTSCCTSDSDSNASQDQESIVADADARPKSKSRAARGTATEPQSIYARKRRERINERLKILQNLVPNGTKVDISTMLEEAVEYVKFLQLQIKLLSSDDMWMYAPIAYNGMSIGIDLSMTR
ncbi:hypothetical protein ACP4OV_023139 [Aristida adscensionis]